MDTIFRQPKRSCREVILQSSQGANHRQKTIIRRNNSMDITAFSSKRRSNSPRSFLSSGLQLNRKSVSKRLNTAHISLGRRASIACSLKGGAPPSTSKRSAQSKRGFITRKFRMMSWGSPFLLGVRPRKFRVSWRWVLVFKDWFSLISRSPRSTERSTRGRQSTDLTLRSKSKRSRSTAQSLSHPNSRRRLSPSQYLWRNLHLRVISAEGSMKIRS